MPPHKDECARCARAIHSLARASSVFLRSLKRYRNRSDMHLIARRHSGSVLLIGLVSKMTHTHIHNLHSHNHIHQKTTRWLWASTTTTTSYTPNSISNQFFVRHTQRRHGTLSVLFYLPLPAQSGWRTRFIIEPSVGGCEFCFEVDLSITLRRWTPASQNNRLPVGTRTRERNVIIIILSLWCVDKNVYTIFDQ